MSKNILNQTSKEKVHEQSPWLAHKQYEASVTDPVSDLILKLFLDIRRIWLKQPGEFQKAESLFKLNGKIFINPKTGKPLTMQQWKEILKTLDKAMLYIFKDKEEALVKKAILLGKILDGMDEDQRMREEYGQLDFSESLPHSDPWNEALTFGEQNSAEYIVALRKKARKDIAVTINDAIKNHKTTRQLEMELFDKFGDLNRDWRRIASTEIANNVNNGILLSEEETRVGGEPIFMKGISMENACKYCVALVKDKVVVLTKGPVKGGSVKIDGKKYIAIWPGKTNYGRDTQHYIATTPIHPNCRCSWTRWYPEFEKAKYLRREGGPGHYRYFYTPTKFSKNDNTKTKKFREWFSGSKVIDNAGKPIIVYHGSDVRIKRFDSNKTQDSLFWFTSDIKSIHRGESGAVSNKYIIPVYLKITNPAGWDEYDKYTIDQLISLGFDGLKLDDTYVAFHANQIKLATQIKEPKKLHIETLKDGTLQIKTKEGYLVASKEKELDDEGEETNREYLLINKVEVKPKYRGKGVARKLLQYFIDSVKSPATIKLAALPQGGLDMDSLVAFYERMGFYVDDTQGGDSVFMTLQKAKYIKREGSPGHYKYFYELPKAKTRMVIRKDKNEVLRDKQNRIAKEFEEKAREHIQKMKTLSREIVSLQDEVPAMYAKIDVQKKLVHSKEEDLLQKQIRDKQRLFELSLIIEHYSNAELPTKDNSILIQRYMNTWAAKEVAEVSQSLTSRINQANTEADKYNLSQLKQDVLGQYKYLRDFYINLYDYNTVGVDIDDLQKEMAKEQGRVDSEENLKYGNLNAEIKEQRDILTDMRKKVDNLQSSIDKKQSEYASLKDDETIKTEIARVFRLGTSPNVMPASFDEHLDTHWGVSSSNKHESRYDGDVRYRDIIKSYVKDIKDYSRTPEGEQALQSMTEYVSQAYDEKIGRVFYQYDYYPDREDIKRINNIRGYLSKFKLKSDMILYRGVNPKILGMDVDSIKQGSILANPGFSSFTSARIKVFERDVTIKYRARKGEAIAPAFIALKNKHHENYEFPHENFTANFDESEFVARDGLRMKVLYVKKQGEHVEITCERAN